LRDIEDARNLAPIPVQRSDVSGDSLVINPTDSTLKLAVEDLVAEQQSVEEALEEMAIEPIDLLKN